MEMMQILSVVGFFGVSSIIEFVVPFLAGTLRMPQSINLLILGAHLPLILADFFRLQIVQIRVGMVVPTFFARQLSTSYRTCQETAQLLVLSSILRFVVGAFSLVLALHFFLVDQQLGCGVQHVFLVTCSLLSTILGGLLYLLYLKKVLGSILDCALLLDRYKNTRKGYFWSNRRVSCS